MVLFSVRTIDLPKHAVGGFDHGDVYEGNGYVYVAHPATGAVELMDGIKGTHLKTIMGCPEASGVVCAQREGYVFAASRGTGKVLVINGLKGTVNRVIQAGSKPNGMAWDQDDEVLLTADIADLNARLVDPERGVLVTKKFPGRPRWCEYSHGLGRFIVNIREPAGVVTVNPRNGEIEALKPVSTLGPHGIDVDEEQGLAYIACDAGAVIALDLKTFTVKWRVKISGEPDVTWFNPRRQLLYVAVAKPGLIEVIDTVNVKVVQQVKTEEGAGTLAFDQSRQRLYSFQPKSCRAAIYVES
jgi:DNA-binding beta-propeller fold protein YncE